MKIDQVHQREEYLSQLNDKIIALKSLMKNFWMEEFEIFESTPNFYRMRCEFRVWHKNNELYYVMFDKEKNAIIKLEQFSPANSFINMAMSELIKRIKSSEILSKKLFQVDFLSSSTNELVITLIYHKKLDETFLLELKKLKQEMKVDFIARSRKQKIILDRDYVYEKYLVNNETLIYQHVENSFTQPNHHVAEKMLNWVFEKTRDCQGDLLELYCGNGNFSLAVAKNFNKVLATEISSSSVDSANHNIDLNNITNVKVIRLSAEEFTQALNGVREFRRLQGIDLKSYNCRTILVDPPRAGIDLESLKLIARYERIIYISCNPETLKENLEILLKTHQLKNFALFDQFPFTHHVECGVVLVRK